MIETVIAGGAAAALVAAGGAWAVGIHEASRRLTQRKIKQHCHTANMLCLTYDDGPGSALTPQLLETLARHDAHATFFLLGRRAQANPETADGVVAAGHEIGCHSHDHLNAWKTLPWQSKADVERGYETLDRWLPDGCIFRPPYGKITVWTKRIARRHNSRLGWWTIDSGDTWRALPSVQSVVDRVRQAGGGVVLMHDFDRETADAQERADFVLGVTDALLGLASETGLRTLPFGQLFDDMEQTES
jgi:peptidoglycan-N-acetylglucosamine deacetylase